MSNLGGYMFEKQSVAEKAGMSFEDRWTKATELLREWDYYHHCGAEERVRSKNKIFAALSGPLQIGLDKVLASPATFDGFLKLVCAMYGEDATSLAAADRSAAAQHAARTTDQGSF